ncbi:MAG: D-2-hydroxyacid dehydrogenase [Pirellulales bacterium]
MKSQTLDHARIVLCYPIEPCHLEQIRAAAPGARVIDAGQERVAAEILDADVFCGHPKVPVDWHTVASQGRLRWIQSSAAGLDHLLVPEIIASDVVVTSASGVLADQVTEHAVALITSWLRRLPTFYEAQKRHEFVRRPTLDLHGMTVGIVGYGGVGRRMAEVLQVFKTRILATDLFPVNRAPHVAELWPADRLPDLLAASDLVVLSVPLTPQTRGLINREMLARMKPTALLANLARGPVVVEADLVAALEEGRLAGAVLDVTEVEPLATTSKLWDLPQVLITPHVAGQSRERATQMTDFFCENLRRYQAGEPLRNLVDKRLGFPKPAGA